MLFILFLNKKYTITLGQNINLLKSLQTVFLIIYKFPKCPSTSKIQNNNVLIMPNLH